ncbi:hypothetical protein M8C21_012900 [Ambrosia artemisiifolia]|uniref:RRM domain-containing protein n=1 Tax=Ambrosia artemisiifolia TaxID=4212 RepID=A0AAD5BRB6_AMBAR|nr:hypothetical protein M8C21_012900 [Ambrosia artemisiifolia]
MAVVESNGVDQSESEVVMSRSNDSDNNFQQEKKVMTNGVLNNHEHHEDEGFKKEMRDLEEILSKLNPMAEEFVPPSLSNKSYNRGVLHSPPAAVDGSNINGVANGRKKGNFGNGKRRINSRTNMAQQEDAIRRTVHVSDIDHQVTEEQLAALFSNCGQVVDCRVCGDPKSVLRFAFIEFTDEDGARNALSLAGTVLGKVTQADVKLFFESFCGEVNRLRLLGDYQHSSRIAFVEFVMAESAIAALNCSGAILGSLPIRVSPSKTPVRPRSGRPLP